MSPRPEHADVDDTPSAGAGPGRRRVHDRVSVVLITYERREEALVAVGRLLDLPETPRVIVVDNGSLDGTVPALRERFAAAVAEQRLDLVALPFNAGATGRNVGVERATTPYAAFCDDDTWWEPGSLERAVAVLDAHEDVAVLTARIVVEPAGTEDPIVAELRDSPVVGARRGLPGPALGSFLAGASVVRASAFTAVGGFDHRLWLGGEEELLAADLASAGWELCFVSALTVHHQASTARESVRRRRDGVRNALWFLLLRRPWPAVARRAVVLTRSAKRDAAWALGVLAALRGLPWVLRERRVLAPAVEARFRVLEAPQAASTARRYVA